MWISESSSNLDFLTPQLLLGVVVAVAGEWSLIWNSVFGPKGIFVVLSCRALALAGHRMVAVTELWSLVCEGGTVLGEVRFSGPFRSIGP